MSKDFRSVRSYSVPYGPNEIVGPSQDVWINADRVVRIRPYGDNVKYMMVDFGGDLWIIVDADVAMGLME